MPLPSPSPQSGGQPAAAGASPLPLRPLSGAVLCPSAGVCPLVPLPHPLLSARFLPGMGEMKEVVRGWGNPSAGKRWAEGGCPEEAWHVPPNAGSPGDTFPFPWSRLLCEGFTHPWKAFSLPAPGARIIMQSPATLRLCRSPASDINARLPACLCLLPLVSLLLSSSLRETELNP